MLRVGLTGDLGSGKSTVAGMLAGRGAVVLSSDEMGRALMQPGHAVYDAIVRVFGPGVVLPDARLDRTALARLAFDPAHPRIEELNAIVHPAVLAEQARRVEQLRLDSPHAIVVIESALIFSTRHAGPSPWATRFDVIVLVTAPEPLKIARFLERMEASRSLTAAERAAAEADARRRLREQAAAERHAGECLVLRNDGTLGELEVQVEALWQELRRREQAHPSSAVPAQAE